MSTKEPTNRLNPRALQGYICLQKYGLASCHTEAPNHVGVREAWSPHNAGKKAAN